jgi:hypothetical protein
MPERRPRPQQTADLEPVLCAGCGGELDLEGRCAGCDFDPDGDVRYPDTEPDPW